MSTALRKSHGTVAAGILSVLLLIVPLAGSILTDASWLWPVATSVLIASVFVLTAPFRSAWRTTIRLLSVNVLFLLNSAYFAAFYIQNQGFNEAFFYHLSPDMYYSGLGEFWIPIAGLAAVYLVANILTPLTSLEPASWRRRRALFLVVSMAGVASFVILPPITSLTHYYVSWLYPNVAKTKVVQFYYQLMDVGSNNTQELIFEVPETIYDLRQEPRLVTYQETRLPNIVFLYLESVERKYFNQNLFPNLLPELTALRARSIDFPNLLQGWGTGWTIAGMVASQCGFPLISLFRLNGNDQNILPTFMPKAVCLGDLLGKAGYTLVYMGGADKRFAGKGEFYRSHGFDEVYGKAELSSLVPDTSYQHAWGLFDDSLFDMAFEKFLSRGRENKPFGLVLLTLDTHHPKGYPSGSCTPYSESDNPILQAVHCTDQLVTRFVKRIRNSPYSKDTFIVIASDHLALQNTATALLKAPGEERLLTFFINTPGQIRAVHATVGMHYDITPTILAVTGLGLEGQLGIGRSLLGQDGYLPGLIGAQTAKVAAPDRRLRDYIESLWSLESITAKSGIMINIGDRTVTLGNQVFDLRYRSDGSLVPTLFEFDPDRLQLVGLFRPEFKRSHWDELSDWIRKGDKFLYLGVGPYSSLAGALEGAPHAVLSVFNGEKRNALVNERIVVFLGRHGAKDFLVGYPGLGPVKVSEAEIARIAASENGSAALLWVPEPGDKVLPN